MKRMKTGLLHRTRRHRYLTEQNPWFSRTFLRRGNLLPAIMLLGVILGCESKPKKNERKLYDVEEVRRMRESAEQCFKQDLLATGSCPVTRANVFSAMRKLRPGEFGPDTAPLVVMAKLHRGRPGGKQLAVLIVSLAPNWLRDKAVFVYVDPKTQRTVRVEYDLVTDDDPDYVAMAISRAQLVPPEQLSKLGKIQEDGTVLVADVALKDDDGGRVFRIPDCEVAVGFHYPDGSYSNFVPLTRHESFFAKPPTTRNAPRPEPPASMPGIDSVEIALTLDLGESVTMRFVRIPAGTFTMGSPAKEDGREPDEGPQHRVTISKPFYMGICEVTQEQFQAITGKNLSHFKGPKNPVEQVHWYHATAFCRKLSTITGMTVRLPTEAEWEYACRAGTTTAFHTGETISTDQANYNGNSTYGNGKKGVYRKKTTPVGSFKPNAFGLYDMHGNVWEWCSDRYSRKHYSIAKKQDPQGPGPRGHNVARGGSWFNDPKSCRSADRTGLSSDVRVADGGFRVVVEGRTVGDAD